MRWSVWVWSQHECDSWEACFVMLSHHAETGRAITFFFFFSFFWGGHNVCFPGILLCKQSQHTFFKLLSLSLSHTHTHTHTHIWLTLKFWRTAAIRFIFRLSVCWCASRNSSINSCSTWSYFSAIFCRARSNLSQHRKWFTLIQKKNQTKNCF